MANKRIDIKKFHKVFVDKLNTNGLLASNIANQIYVDGIRPHDLESAVEILANGGGNPVRDRKIIEAIADQLNINLDALVDNTPVEKKGPMGHATRKPLSRTRGGSDDSDINT